MRTQIDAPSVRMRHARCQRAEGNASRLCGSRGGAVRMLLAAVNESREVSRGKGSSRQSVRMPSGGCQRIENGSAGPETAGLLFLLTQPRAQRGVNGAAARHALVAR